MSAGDNYLEWKRRATQAERERDEARRILSEAAPETLEEVVAAAVDCLDDGPRLAMAKHARRMETRAREEKAARERAEADNAALLGRLRSTKRLIESGQPLAALADIDEDARHGLVHPGAALLERLHVAIAYAATGLREYHGHRCGMAGGPHPDNPRECNDAHCRQWAHDLAALKERKP